MPNRYRSSVCFRLVQVDSLDTNEETFSLIYSTQLYWYDPKLVWHVPDFKFYEDNQMPKVWKEFIENNNLSDYANLTNSDIAKTFQDSKRKFLDQPDKKDPTAAKDLTEIIDYMLHANETIELMTNGKNTMYNYYNKALTSEEQDLLYQYLSVQYINVKPSEIWTPSLIAYNSNEAKHFNFMQEADDQTECTIFSDGLVIWEPIIKHTVNCDLGMSYFPFDVQMCYLDLGSGSFSAENFNILLADTTKYLEKLNDTNSFMADKNLDLGLTEGPLDAYSINNAENDVQDGEWDFIAAGIRIGQDSFIGKTWVRFFVIN